MKRFFCVLLFIAAVIGGLLLCDHVTRRDDSERKFRSFYDEKQDIDVFFMGTSHVLDDITPMELWRDFGVTSYNMGTSSECLGMTEWILKLTAEVHKPKIAVIDVYYIDKPLDSAWTYSYRHLFFDSYPLSFRKFEAVRATLPKEQWMEFMMPFSLYHSRWEELMTGTSARMIDCEPFMMGSEMRIGRGEPLPYTRTHAMTEGELPGVQALRNIAAYCRENGIEPVFMALPAPSSEQQQADMNSVQRLADELDVPFLNLFDEDTGIDFYTDCYDYLGHMNPDGASKLTHFVGQWLTEHYALDDCRGDDAYSAWNEKLAQYEAYRAENWENSEFVQSVGS